MNLSPAVHAAADTSGALPSAVSHSDTQPAADFPPMRLGPMPQYTMNLTGGLSI
jgi:hypothetical protein